jgi:predicted nucleotidyltransferase
MRKTGEFYNKAGFYFGFYRGAFPMDKREVIEKTRTFALSLPSNLNLREVVLFGSWVDGSPSEESDIDIAVVVKELKSDYLNLLTKLYHLASTIDIRIEPLLFEENKDDSGFLEEILKRGEIVYGGEVKTH